MAAKKTSLANALLDLVLRNQAYASQATVYACLFTANPDAGNPGTEVTGGSYLRKAVTFATQAAAGTVSNTAAVTFDTATALWGTVTGVGLSYTLASGGDDLLYFGALGTSKVVDVGDQLNFAIGALSVTES